MEKNKKENCEFDDSVEKLERLKKILEECDWEVEESPRNLTKRKAAELESIGLADFEHELEFLDEMDGMEGIKETLMRLGRFVQWKRKLSFAEIDTTNLPTPNLTFMFLGDSGTGKTTVARHMGKILHSLELIASEEVFEIRREDLVGENYGCEEINTREALEKAKDGVFFLDETYQCFKQATDRRDPGYHILEVMMQEFGKPGRCIIMAGYKKEMMEIFNVNPGFRSRIPDENIIELKRMSEDLLMNVARRNLEKMGFSLTSGARKLLHDTICTMSSMRGENFGNARDVKQLTECIVITHANRIMTTTLCDDFSVTKDDVRRSIDRQFKNNTAHNRIGYM